MASALRTQPDSVSRTSGSASSPRSLASSTSPFHIPTSSPSSGNTITSPPFVHVEGVPNFRDLGGYPCSPPSSTFDPQKSYLVRPLTLFRSAQPNNITSRGTLTVAKQLKVCRFYDLRSERETGSKTQSSKDLKIDGIEWVFTPVFRDEDLSPEALALKHKNYTSPDEDGGHGYSAGFVRAYRDILLNAGPAFKSMFEHIRDRNLAEPDSNSSPSPSPDSTRPEPFLFHCAAGKDRTGVFAALVLRLCGVADEIVAWEYSITAEGLGSWKETIIAHMMKGAGSSGTVNLPMSREQAERVVGSRAKTMLVFLRDVLDGEIGGVESYMQEKCGLGPADIHAIRTRLVVQGDSPFGDGSGYWKA